MQVIMFGAGTTGRILYSEIASKDDEIFVLGDNRLRSADSRTLGTFKYSDIIGKKGIIIYPFSNMEFIS